MKQLIRILEKYKVLLEVGCVMIAGLIISVCQLLAVHKQNNLIKIQYELARVQAMPQFIISYNQIFNGKTGKYDNDEILIENRGGFISDFSVKNVDFLKVIYVDQKIPNSYTNYVLPLNGYFNSQGVIATSGTGDLMRLTGFNNNARFIELQSGLRQLAEGSKSIVNLEQEHIARLSYKDIIGLHHEEYYEIKPVYGGNLLSENEGAVWFEKYNSSLGLKRGPLQLDLLAKTPEIIFSGVPNSSSQ